ncbi:MAG: hypothetical protein ABH884_02295, partial [Candidatus Komeilibacteria bacterium]
MTRTEREVPTYFLGKERLVWMIIGLIVLLAVIWGYYNWSTEPTPVLEVGLTQTDPYDGTEYVPGYGFGSPEEVTAWNEDLVRIERELSEGTAQINETIWHTLYQLPNTDWDLI